MSVSMNLVEIRALAEQEVERSKTVTGDPASVNLARCIVALCDVISGPLPETRLAQTDGEIDMYHSGYRDGFYDATGQRPGTQPAAPTTQQTVGEQMLTRGIGAPDKPAPEIEVCECGHWAMDHEHTPRSSQGMRSYCRAMATDNSGNRCPCERFETPQPAQAAWSMVPDCDPTPAPAPAAASMVAVDDEVLVNGLAITLANATDDYLEMARDSLAYLRSQGWGPRP